MKEVPKYGSVLIIDDHKMITNGIELLIGDMFEHFYRAYDGAEGISKALQQFPQLIIVDYALPDTTGDLLVRELKYKMPSSTILAYTFTCAPEIIIKMFQSGINGFVIKDENDEEFVQAVQVLMKGGTYFCKAARNHIVNRFSGTDDAGNIRHLIANTEFATKEIQLIRLLCKQMNTKEISRHIGLSERTVEQYRSNITRRIGAKNLAGVIKFALQNGIIQMDDL